MANYEVFYSAPNYYLMKGNIEVMKDPSEKKILLKKEQLELREQVRAELGVSNG